MRKSMKKRQKSNQKWSSRRPKGLPKGASKNRGETQDSSGDVPWPIWTISGGLQVLKNTIFYEVFQRVTKNLENQWNKQEFFIFRLIFLTMQKRCKYHAKSTFWNLLGSSQTPLGALDLRKQASRAGETRVSQKRWDGTENRSRAVLRRSRETPWRRKRDPGGPIKHIS